MEINFFFAFYVFFVQEKRKDPILWKEWTSLMRLEKKMSHFVVEHRKCVNMNLQCASCFSSFEYWKWCVSLSHSYLISQPEMKRDVSLQNGISSALSKSIVYIYFN